MIVYKYVHPDRLDVLENSEIRFSQAAALNDPFETMPCFSLVRKHLKQLMAQRYFKCTDDSLPSYVQPLIDSVIADIPKQFSEHFCILSLSKKRNNLLMWSHYADSHRGFVIGFDSGSPFFLHGSGKAVDGLREVTYSNNREVVPGKGFHSIDRELMNKANQMFFFTKSSDWGYEEELRILAHPNAADKTTRGNDGFDICLFRFPPECMREVIFGYRIPASKRQRIADLVARKYSQTALFQAVINESYFQLDIKPYA
jgi:hypothetical protein